MKNRVLGLAVVAGALGMALPPVPLFSHGGMPSIGVAGSGASQNGLRVGGVSGSSLAGMFSGGGLHGGSYRPSYKKRGWSVAEDRRRARKRRNKLRAKGHHRKAVR